MARMTRIRSSSLTLRLLGGAGLWTAGALIAAGILLSFLFRGSVERGFDARLSVFLDALIGVAELDDSGALQVTRPLFDPRFNMPYSGLYWQITPRQGEALRSRSLWDQALETDLSVIQHSAHRFVTTGPERQALRGLERDITLPGSNALFRFSVAAETSDITREVATFNRALFLSLSALGIGLLLAVVVQVRFGLSPLRRIRRALAEVRSGKAQRLDDDFPEEILPLVHELNALLDHNAQVVERARTHVGNLAHALKTPLSVLANEAGEHPGPMSEIVAHQVEQMRRHVDHHLIRARARARGRVIGSRTPIVSPVRDLVRALVRIYADRDLTIDVRLSDAAERLVFAGERQDFDEMLGNLLDNACKWGQRRIVVAATRERDVLRITVDDDGPGIAPEQRDAVFRRGDRFDRTVPGSGLGLAIVRDIARLCEGRVTLGESPLGGVRAELQLPAAPG